MHGPILLGAFKGGNGSESGNVISERDGVGWGLKCTWTLAVTVEE